MIIKIMQILIMLFQQYEDFSWTNFKWETNSSLQDGNESENSDWERNVLNLKKRWCKNRKRLVFSNSVTYNLK